MGVNSITRNKYKRNKIKDYKDKSANNENFFKVEKI